MTVRCCGNPSIVETSPLKISVITAVYNSEAIFLFSTTTILEAFAAYAPEVLSATRVAFDAAEKDLSFTRLAAAPWAELPDISIDYAVMERAPNLSVVPYAGA